MNQYLHEELRKGKETRKRVFFNPATSFHSDWVRTQCWIITLARLVSRRRSNLKQTLHRHRLRNKYMLLDWSWKSSSRDTASRSDAPAVALSAASKRSSTCETSAVVLDRPSGCAPNCSESGKCVYYKERSQSPTLCVEQVIKTCCKADVSPQQWRLSAAFRPTLCTELRVIK